LDVCYNRKVLSSSISSSILRRTTTVASTGGASAGDVAATQAPVAADPYIGAKKPELVAPGVHVDVSPKYQDTGATSVATPLAAAFATVLMERRSWLRARPDD
ncbi:MAG: S8 family serine peptidase, partial [Polyangiaceae bacterium]|nr:S8 family serine peptidase [Polyangiaceae bacterium]